MRHLSEHEIRELHALAEKPDEYMNQYKTVHDLGISPQVNIQNMDAPRVFCIADFKQWVEKYDIAPKSILSTCITDPELKFLKYQEMKHIPYDETTGQNDLHTLDLHKKDYDFMLFSQTLEHVCNPLLVVSNIANHIAKDGYVFTSVPFINIPHMEPYHFQHFSPMGLASLFHQCDLRVVELGYWGNLDYIQTMYRTMNWPTVFDLSSITNERGRAAQCWVLAQKA